METETLTPVDELVGRELDAAVAEEVMGVEVLGEASCWAPDGDWSVRQESLDDDGGRPRLVMPGHCCCDRIDELWPTDRPPKLVHGHTTICLEVVPEYSTDIAAAWEVLEKLQTGAGYPDEGAPDAVYHAFRESLLGMDGSENIIATAHIAAKRICRAALKAVRGET